MDFDLSPDEKIFRLGVAQQKVVEIMKALSMEFEGGDYGRADGLAFEGRVGSSLQDYLAT
jgi:hypothetical protein